MRTTFASVALTALGACTVIAPAPNVGAGTRASIAISVGPCFGFCPVYDAKITADGAVSFGGIRHTALLGKRERRAGPRTYGALDADLAPFRPVDGATAEISCAAEISDMPTYTITWTGTDGQKTVATHHAGCSEGAGRDFDIVLRGVPRRLGIEEWMKQTTWPGVSRG